MTYTYAHIMNTTLISILGLLRHYYNQEVLYSPSEVACKIGMTHRPTLDKIVILCALGYLERIKTHNRRKLRSDTHYCIITERGKRLYDVLAELSTANDQYIRDTTHGKRISPPKIKTLCPR